jgi:hypothetical protein
MERMERYRPYPDEFGLCWPLSWYIYLAGADGIVGDLLPLPT